MIPVPGVSYLGEGVFIVNSPERLFVSSNGQTSRSETRYKLDGFRPQVQRTRNIIHINSSTIGNAERCWHKQSFMPKGFGVSHQIFSRLALKVNGVPPLPALTKTGCNTVTGPGGTECHY